MKTKTIFKTLALAMLMPTMLLTTACSNNDDEIVNTENPANTKGYALPVTINVTRQGDATRATFDGSKLNFSAGDKLFVKGNDYDAGSFAGTLNYVSGGTFNGTIYTQNSYPSTSDNLFKYADSKRATLLPAGYDSYSYLTIEEEGTYGAYLDTHIGKAFALTKAAAVEQFSLESASSYSSGFALAPQNAIVSFTISGLTANTAVAVLFKDNYDISATPVNVTTDATGVATFAVGMYNYANFDNYSLTVDGNAIALPAAKNVVAGKIYNISRSVAPAGPTAYTLAESTVGMIVGSDGNAYAAADKDNLPSGVTAVAIVAYVGSGTDHATYTHGLAIALADESSSNWSTAKSTCEGKTAVSGATWLLPSQNQWKAMFGANGGNEGSYSGLNTALANAGGTALQGSDGIYWTSTDSGYAYSHFIAYLNGGSVNFWADDDTNSNRVRACLAF